jgi:hypothetical protein
MGWNQDRGQELNRPQDYGLLGGDPETSEGRSKNLYHQQMMELILSAMLSDKGRGAYRGAQVEPTKTPTPVPPPAPNVIQQGIERGYGPSNAEEEYRRLVGGG